MKNDKTLFKIIYYFTTTLYSLLIAGWLLIGLGSLLVYVFGLTGLVGEHTWNGWGISFMIGSIEQFDMFVLFYESLMTVVVLALIRRFLKNLLTDKIFITQNVRLIKIASVGLLLSSVSFDDSYINIYLILVALLVWVFAKILEKAVVIAEENEFTI